MPSGAYDERSFEKVAAAEADERRDRRGEGENLGVGHCPATLFLL